ncbi:MAG TPA: hypothetical protein DCO93_01905 [Clostridiales bacterium]|nr:hypothetical protein [Clostridiales bacterium]
MDDSIFLSRMRDIARLCDKYRTAKFSRFLDSREQVVLEHNRISGTLFGGYEDAERRILGVFPKWQEPELSLFPIDLLKITVKGEQCPSHRQYLGTILSLGIERDRIGDILTEDNGAYVFVSSDISQFIKDNITKIGKCRASVEYTDLGSVDLPGKEFENIQCVCASLRLDAIVAGLTGISRNEAKKIILSGKVFVNHFDAQKIDFPVKEGDLLSVRGFGRAKIEEIGAKTRSDRIHITFKKYI